MNKRFAVLSLLLTTSVTCFAAMADNATELRAKLSNIDSLHATFSQQVTDINNKPIQTGSGVFALAYPNQFYWHLTQPDESLIVADGANLWIYNPFAEEVTVMDVAQAVDASPMALLVHRDEATWAKYSVTKRVINATSSCFDIQPKKLNSNVIAVSVCFDAKQLVKFNLTDEQGNLSQFSLTEQRSVKVDETNIFNFAVPDNVDIDDQRLKQAH
ncbi:MULTISPECIES: outer membrane lipoprotein chaperone LolA [Shewanella]|uniref:outer membrane lipoprotein chaperone LolA n=1 Tax=Shewanella TaxID=22 RepID=UPI000C6728DB|nr:MULTISPECIES: outer membrane lipoprotein chaperone LolA [Shewanella]NCQ43756.1 outer membrane lipoprotein chaperone LolA [Shewanella frigidimarina]MBB1391615.1 outer membrane lipoprotein chaperone LolA [Shewanella sp. SG44-6]NCO70130.1 outer membrane lipoprotein chaperone LolA [Shewanella vesiculosa]NCP35670.1 outer membrane lipoprotein chaperone LolA [Shewanella vesiculosa]NCP68251.1 outer membrane lipoprotein chaperone LolA [Shewanella vesiculosa]|tara:strand:- start:1611 stop:2255 length:645 start_codon:yes stop_codon:yes gene_type:complete